MALRDTQVNLFLQLEDRRLEREFWRDPCAAGGLWVEAVSCLFNVCMQASFVRAYNGREAREGLFLCMNLLILLLSTLQLALLLGAQRQYLRLRVPLQVAQRLVKIVNMAMLARFNGDRLAAWFRARLLAPGADGLQLLRISLVGFPLVCLFHTLSNPCPMALQPALSAGLFWVYWSGWLPLTQGIWEHPKVADATGRALCHRLQLALLTAESATISVLGGPSVVVPQENPQETAPAPSRERCRCLLQAAAISLVLVIGLALPNLILWSIERKGKRAFARGRGCRLRVRIPLVRRLRSHLFKLGWRPGGAQPGLLVAAAALLAGLMVAWQAGETLAAWRSPQCRACL